MSSLPSELVQLFSYIEANKERYIEDLKAAVSIKSVSSCPNSRHEVQHMITWCGDKLKNLKVDVELVDLGEEELSDGKTIALPNVILGSLGQDPKKKTVLVYGHLDVQPALKEDGWNTEPFELTEKEGKLYGRGASDDKGPVLCWIHALEAYKSLNIDIPVNMKFVFEGMEESGSIGLEDLLLKRKDDFLANVDYVSVSDNYWLGSKKPCLTYGLRGLTYFTVEVECASKDMHSGLYGGTVHEALPDLCWLLSTLVDKDTNILVPDIQRDVAPLLYNEHEIYENIDYNVADYKKHVGVCSLPHNEDKVKLLMARWRYPSLSIHGIEGAFYGPGAKTVIPAKVTGKFSIRLVPNQDPQHVAECVIKYLNEKWQERGSPNKMKVTLLQGAKSWTTNPNHPHFLAAKKAARHVYKVDPDMTREGGSIPIVVTLQNVTGKNVIMIPIGAGDDGAHSQNEKIDVFNYIEGTKMLGAYLYEVSKLT